MQPANRGYRNFSLLTEEEPFSLSPSVLAGGGAGFAMPHATAATAATAPSSAPSFFCASSSFSGLGDLTRSLQEVGGGGGGGASGGAWDFSAFGTVAASALLPAAAAPAAPAVAAAPVAFSRERAVAHALLQAHESQATALTERIRAADLSNKQRSRSLRSITVGANYRSRLATKSAKKKALQRAWGK